MKRFHTFFLNSWPFWALGLIAFLAFFQIAFFQYVLKWDIIDAVFPWKYFIAESLQAHQLPLWNPFQHCGYPIHADPQSTAWYPVTWFIGYFCSYSIYTIALDWLLHVYMAGVGMFLLGQTLRFSKQVAFAVAVAYMLSGFMVGNAQHINWIIAATWIPFVLNFFIQIHTQRGWQAVFGLSLSVFMMLSGAYPAFGMVLVYLLIALFIYFFWQKYSKQSSKQAWLYLLKNAVAAVLAVLNGLVVFVSVWQLTPHLSRAGGIALRDALFGAFTMPSLRSFVLPYASVGSNTALFGTDLSMTNIYFGLFLLVFLVFAFSIRKTAIQWIFLGFGLLMLWLSIGQVAGLRELFFNYVPFFNLFRFPALLRIFTIFSFLIVAGDALQKFLVHPHQYWRKLQFAFVGVFVILLTSTAAICYGQYLNLGEFLASSSLFHFSMEDEIPRQAFFQALVQLVLLTLFFVAAFAFQKKRISFWPLAVLMVMDLTMAVQLNAPYTVYDQWRTPKETHQAMKSIPQVFPLHNDYLLAENSDEKSAHLGCMWRNVNIFHKRIAADGYNPLKLREFVFLEDSLPQLLDLATHNALFYFASGIKPMSDFVKELIDTQLVFVENNSPLSELELSHQHPNSIEHISFLPNKLVVETFSRQSELLVFMQNNYPGWKAFVDEKESSIIVVNQTFMAVVIPPGSHKVQFEFRPAKVSMAFWISIISILITILLWFSFDFVTSRNKN